MWNGCRLMATPIATSLVGSPIFATLLISQSAAALPISTLLLPRWRSLLRTGWPPTKHAQDQSRSVLARHLYEVRNPIRQMLRLALEGRITVKRRQKPYSFVAEAPGFL